MLAAACSPDLPHRISSCKIKDYLPWHGDDAGAEAEVEVEVEGRPSQDDSLMVYKVCSICQKAKAFFFYYSLH